MIEKKFVLQEASEKECRERDQVTYHAWGKRLDQEQYLDLKIKLRQHPFAKKSLRSWLLSRDEIVLASCETYCMKSHVVESSSEGVTECVGNFFVEPGFRGKGHGIELWTQILALLRREEVQASIIFSEIGDRLYFQGGYQIMKGFLWNFTQEDFRGEFRDESRVLPEPQVEWISAAGLPKILGKRDLICPGQFGLVAEHNQVDWHLCRARIYAEALSKPAIERIGASHKKSWILWAHDFLEGNLLVLWMEATTQEEGKHLIAAALQEAEGYDFKAILIWPNPSLHRVLVFGRRAPFKDIPRILPISPELRAKDWTTVTAVHRF